MLENVVRDLVHRVGLLEKTMEETVKTLTYMVEEKIRKGEK